MPLSSLRPRTANEQLSPQEEHEIPSPYRARSSTIPGLTPRKSLQSLMGSMRRRNNLRPPPRFSRDLLEQGVYPEHETSKGDDTRQATSAYDSKRYYRTPSPHPVKSSAASSLSILSKLSRGPGSRRSSSPPVESTRTFLETLADAIRAPTALFYKEKKDNSDAASPSASEPSSPAKSLNSKKSVRFKPGRSIIEDQPKSSSPIDIPRAPSLPPMQLGTTPFLQCIRNEHPDLIPTARPREPPVLESSINFRQAKVAACRPTVEQDDREIQNLSTLPSPLSELETSILETSEPARNLFVGTKQESDPVSRYTALFEYEKKLSRKDTERPPYVELDKDSVAEEEKVQDLSETTSVNTEMATVVSKLTPDRRQRDASSSTVLSQVKKDSAHLFPEIDCNLSAKGVDLENTKLFPECHDSDSETSIGPAAFLKHLLPQSRRIEQEWTDKPTHEDIRFRFQHPVYDSASLSDVTDTASESLGSSEDVCNKTNPTPLLNDLEHINSAVVPPPASHDQSAMSVKKNKHQPQTNLEDDTCSHDLLRHITPWSAELVLDHGWSGLLKGQERSKPRQPTEDLSFTEAKSEDEGDERVARLPRYVEHDGESPKLFWADLHALPPPFPGRAVSREICTPPPAWTPSHLSPGQPARYSYELHRNECVLRPSEDEDGCSIHKLPPGQFCLFAEEASSSNDLATSMMEKQDNHEETQGVCRSQTEPFNLTRTSMSTKHTATESEEPWLATKTMQTEGEGQIARQATGWDNHRDSAIPCTIPAGTTSPPMDACEHRMSKSLEKVSRENACTRSRATTMATVWTTESKESRRSDETLATHPSIDKDNSDEIFADQLQGC